MPRRNRPPKRVIDPDTRYNSVLVAQFINRLMKGGKMSTATRVMYDALDLVEARSKRNPLEVFEQAMQNVMPVIEVKPRRVGGSTYQIPVEVSSHRRLALGMRWMLATSRSRPGKSMAEKLAAEFMDAAQGQGSTVKKKEDTHKMAEANRAFSHYRW
jgi:small subunit ribosomal protein S7